MDSIVEDFKKKMEANKLRFDILCYKYDEETIKDPEKANEAWKKRIIAQSKLEELDPFEKEKRLREHPPMTIDELTRFHYG